MTPASNPDRDVRWAWGFVVLIVAGGILAQLVGYGIATLLGYTDSEQGSPPVGAALLIRIPALAIAAAPGTATLYFGVRAGQGRRFSGYLAAAIGALTIVYWVVVAVISVLNPA
ncbi:MAG: hypothetical protein NTX29_14270 [Actinobacteria bacterium]|nr:hypothetical protein [Actinomycetota bacterium]